MNKRFRVTFHIPWRACKRTRHKRPKENLFDTSRRD